MFRRCARLPIALAALLFALSPSTLKAEGRPTPVSGRASLEDAPAASLSAPALVARGTERFRRGNYDGAIADFYAAYERQQVPTLLFNIAQAHRKSGRGKDALKVFEQFKLADPKSSLLPEVDAYIAELKAKPPTWGLRGLRGLPRRLTSHGDTGPGRLQTSGFWIQNSIERACWLD